MKTVAIICEYNPFHNGHLYHINEIRREFGEDTAIIAVMSGNYTQRGDVAIADKALRAKWALDAGVNLVLELPFPFSSASAEFFASAGVYIASQMNAELLSFGSECGDVALLESAAQVMLSDEYNELLKILSESSETCALGYPELCELAFSSLCGTTTHQLTFTPNNILAIEYIKAIKKLNVEIQPHTVKRVGASFNSETLCDTSYQSASAIRNEFIKNNYSALDYLPISTKNDIIEAEQNGELPCNAGALDKAIISFFRLNSQSGSDTIHDARGGLYNRLVTASLEANDIQNLTRLTETKKFTKARIRRAIWYSFFGVTSSEVKCLPRFTQLLAADGTGRALLKKMKKRRELIVLTKPSSIDEADEQTKKQILLSQKADSVFQLTKPRPPRGSYAVTFTPYVKK